jgi:7-carboxy-7-deazaguanine synthase
MYACGPGRKTETEDIVSQVLAHQKNFVVITGGEPFLQWDNGLKTLEAELMARGCFIQYETSGRLRIPETARGYIVCSPKIVDGRWRFDLQNIPCVDAFKFVVKDEFEAVKAFVKSHAIANTQVWIMPRCSRRREQLALFRPLWQFCVKNQYNFSPRLHILAFDSQKGV